MSDELQTFRVEVDGSGVSHRVWVDGAEQQGVRSFAVEHVVGSYPVVSLERAAGVVLEGRGLVDEVVPADGRSIVAWLDQVDPEALEKASLRNADFDTPMAVSMLQALREMALDTRTPQEA